MKHFPLYTPLALLASSLCASAQLFVPVSQDRSLEVDVAVEVSGTTIASDADAASAPDFGPWLDQTDASVFAGGILTEAHALQDSSILGDRIEALGFGLTFSTNVNDASTRVVGAARSRCQVTFDTAALLSIDVAGSIFSLGNGAEVLVELSDAGGTLWSASVSTDGATEDLDASLLIPAGRYTLRAEALSRLDVTSTTTTVGDNEYDLVAQLARPVTSYCIASPNSAGPGAQLSATGSVRLQDNEFTVVAEGAPPSQMGLFYYGANAIQVPFGDGFRCVGGATWRLSPPAPADAGGVAARAIDFTVPPAGGGGAGTILPQSTWNLQYWYRDPAAGGSGYNLSNALAVTFRP